MRRKLAFFLFVAALLSVGVPASAQLWSGILAPSRATDWSQAGVTGGIPNRTTICATLSPGATAAQINNAIAACPSGQVVYLNGGTYNLSSSIVINRSNVTLRGQGMSTILNFTSCSSGYYWGAACIYVQSSNFVPGGWPPPPPGANGSASTQYTWIGTNGQSGVYTQGATTINLGQTPTGLTAGMTAILWQTDVPDASLPNSGYFVSDKTGASGAISWQGAGAESANSGQQQRVKVESVNGSTVTISRGLIHPTGTWTTAQSPKLGWQPGQLTGVGLENFRATKTAVCDQQFIGLNNANDSWVKGVGLVSPAALGMADNVLHITESRNVTVQDSWWDNWNNYPQSCAYNTTAYGIRLIHSAGALIQNNIFRASESPIMLNLGTVGSVIAYNYEAYTGGEGGFQIHDEAPALNLYEGNSIRKFWADFFHGNAVLNTFFRNHFYTRGIDLSSYHRWFNAVGNVINASVYESYCNTPPLYDRFGTGGNLAFRLGYPQQYADCSPTSGVAFDTVVRSSLMRWGNYATTGGTRWLASEVPSTDPLFPNPVPASQSLPASFYYAARPSWWPAAKAWPPIGPDVTGGNISGYAGHAYTIPAQDCYSAAGGNVANFSPAGCYGQSGGIAPAAPSNLRTQ